MTLVKGKVEQCPPLHLGVVVIKKGALGSPPTKVTSFTKTVGHYVIKTDIIWYYFWNDLQLMHVLVHCRQKYKANCEEYAENRVL